VSEAQRAQSETRAFAALGLAFATLIALTHLRTARVSSDTFYVLAAGQEMARFGLPHTNTLTELGHGALWVNPQWLAQLAFTSVMRVTGFAGLVIVRALLGGLALFIALWMGRRGALVVDAKSPGLHTLLIAFAALVLLVPHANIRAQSFAEVLFALTLALLFWAELSWGRVLTVAALLALWANVHGSVLLGCGLVALHGLLSRAPMRPRLALIAAAIVAPCITPYGLEALSYYRAMRTVGASAPMTEWAPLTPAEAPLVWALALVALVLAARTGRIAIERALPLALTALLALTGARHTSIFALALVFHAPALLAQASPKAFHTSLSGRAGSAWLGLTGLAFIITTSLLVVHHNAAIAVGYPVSTSEEVARLAGDAGLVFADESQADRLLLQAPALRGRVAYDARAEVIPRDDMMTIMQLARGGDTTSLGWLASRYQVLVLDREAKPRLLAAVRADARWARALVDPHAEVFVRRDYAPTQTP
jgi:hypothetical protein